MSRELTSLHPTTATIDLDALAFNLHQVRTLLGKAQKVLAVVKANAYGHGAVPIARELEAQGVEFFGVAFLEEGVRLRRAGIRRPILILGGTDPSESEEVLSFELTPVVYDYTTASALEAEAKRQGKTIPIHVKVDTGMNRLGVSGAEAGDFFARVRSLGHLRVEGVLSHFSSAHLIDDESLTFTQLQARRFKEVVEQLAAGGVCPQCLHMANSSAVLGGALPESSLARVGLMLYGAYPSRELGRKIPLRPVMTLATKVIQVHSLPAGSPISYSRTYVTTREHRIATLAVGYGDGYPYRLSNRGEVLIHGQSAPVVGSVCMDFTMVDVTAVPETKVGDQVVVLGSQGEARIAVEEVAERAGTIPYEILCGVSSRVPRHYLKAGQEVDVA
jgi:alanine racemase